MTDDTRPTPPRRKPRAASDETGPDVAEVASPVSPISKPDHVETALPTVQLNTRISAELYQLVVDAKYDRRTTIREVVEHALHTTYTPN